MHKKLSPPSGLPIFTCRGVRIDKLQVGVAIVVTVKDIQRPNTSLRQMMGMFGHHDP